MTKREKLIIDKIHEILHSGLSIDCEPDQDYVCEVIDEAVEKIIHDEPEPEDDFCAGCTSSDNGMNCYLCEPVTE